MHVWVSVQAFTSTRAPAQSLHLFSASIVVLLLQIDLKCVADGNLILATAEQWDRLSRRWRQRRAVSDLSLFIADELHLLGGDNGPTLEVVASRMRAVAKLLAKPIRFVGLGSSIADAKDVGDWMGVPAHAQFNFPPGARAVPLEIHINSLDIASFEARLQVRSAAQMGPQSALRRCQHCAAATVLRRGSAPSNSRCLVNGSVAIWQAIASCRCASLCSACATVHCWNTNLKLKLKKLKKCNVHVTCRSCFTFNL